MDQSRSAWGSIQRTVKLKVRSLGQAWPMGEGANRVRNLTAAGIPLCGGYNCIGLRARFWQMLNP